jgi:hypothetical protein
MRTPDFFIVGAPKAGTSALYRYLREHPSIFMPQHQKEPFFFLRDAPGFRVVTEEHEYLELFADANDRHLAVGEASTLYLSSEGALRGIRTYDPRARVIALLRNPVDLVPSFHAQLRYTFEEDVEDVEEAWRLQALRARGERIPATCRDPYVLQYEHIARLGSQVQRLLSLFPREQVLILLAEDQAADPGATYRRVLRFLGVPDDGRTEFPRVNERKSQRVPSVDRWLARPPSYARRLRAALGLRNTGLGRLLKRLNARPVEKTTATGAFREELARAFQKEVEVLEGILNRDLRHWLEPRASADRPREEVAS